jgi:hypothetical protein
MFYAANVPASPFSNEKRIDCFEYGLRTSTSGIASVSRRPHLYYSSVEFLNDEMPVSVSPLQNDYLNHFSPMKGKLTKEEDRVKIQTLMEALQPYIEIRNNLMTPRFEGERNSDGEKHGNGKEILSTGDIYIGTFVNNYPEKGTMYYSNGDVYVGEWKRSLDTSKFGERSGKGVVTYFNGDKFDGNFINDKREGQGVFRCANGNTHITYSSISLLVF